jgi:hypothetical protein
MTDPNLQFFPVVGSGARVSINFVRMVVRTTGHDEDNLLLNLTMVADSRYYFSPPNTPMPLPVVVYGEIEL